MRYFANLLIIFFFRILTLLLIASVWGMISAILRQSDGLYAVNLTEMLSQTMNARYFKFQVMYNCILFLLDFLFYFHIRAHKHPKYQELCLHLHWSVVIYLPRKIFFDKVLAWQSLKCLNWRKLKRVISHKTDTKYGYILAQTLKVELRASEWVHVFPTKLKSR